MTNNATIMERDEVEAMEESRLPVQIEDSGGFDLARVENPTAAIEVAERLVQKMAAKCSGQSYIARISGKQYPKVEWWTTVGASLGLFPREESNKRLDREDEIAYEATVAVFNGDKPVTRASAICSSKERTWSGRDEYAIRSMAATRATAKAFRIGLSFLATLAGLEATPAEEVPDGGFDGSAGSDELDLDAKVGWGKHAELTWRELAEQEPGYIKWAAKNTDRITEDMLTELRDAVRKPSTADLEGDMLELPSIDGEVSIAALEERAGVGMEDRFVICKRLGFARPKDDPDGYAAELRRIIAERQEMEA